MVSYSSPELLTFVQKMDVIAKLTVLLLILMYYVLASFVLEDDSSYFDVQTKLESAKVLNS